MTHGNEKIESNLLRDLRSAGIRPQKHSQLSTDLMSDVSLGLTVQICDDADFIAEKINSRTLSEGGLFPKIPS